MARATFGVSASCFAANMAVKQNAIDLSHVYPLAAEAVEKSFMLMTDSPVQMTQRQQPHSEVSCVTSSLVVVLYYGSGTPVIQL